MAHFYKYGETKSLFMDEIKTPAQARKCKDAVYPSVTTILSIIKDPFLDGIYKPKKITELARQYPSMYWMDVADLVYGQRQHPTSNELIPSSEFGTAVHKRIEDYVEFDLEFPFGTTKHEMDRSIWDDWAKPFVDWYKEKQVQPIASEQVLACDKVKTAGSVDFIGRWKDGGFFLADYKCRSCKGGKPKFYDKDCYQLAIEALFLKQDKALGYMPECISVCIDTDTCKHYRKHWKKSEVLHGIKVAKLCSKLYWGTRMQ
tara:strand:+ start:707 stop:1483 length:777 start_codon:yes stop_codon:yes gene_type:complete